jgi:branched-chain amino acid transport system permease protein
MRKSIVRVLQKVDLPIIAIFFLLLTPLIGMQRTTDFIIFCIFVLAYDLLYGYLGRLSFGHMLYLGIGAYTAALCAEHISGNPFIAILVAVAAGAACGLLLGPIIVRTTGACFALINLAFNQLGHFMAVVAFARWTGGEDGMSVSFKRVWGLSFTSRTTVLFLALSSLILTVLFLRKLTGSPFGILLRSIKENETRVKFLGYNTFAAKMTAFSISTGIAAFAGALFAINYTYVTPSFIDTTRNVEVIFAGLIGGAGSVYGAISGGVIYMFISNYLPKYIQRWEMFLGFTLLLLVFRFRAGVWGSLVALENRWSKGGLSIKTRPQPGINR